MDQQQATTPLADRGYEALCRAVAERRRLLCGVDIDEVAFRDLLKKGHIDGEGRPHVEAAAAIKVRLHRRGLRRK